MASSDIHALIQQALAGDEAVLGTLLERYRSYLRILASRELDPIMNPRLSGSDIVQQTFLEAHRDLRDFRGTTEPEFLGWLRQILAHNLAEATQQHIVAKKRSLHSEQPSPRTGDDGRPLNTQLAANQSSPSSRAMRGEQAIRLSQEMQQLPSDQFEAIRLRYIEGWSLSEIAVRLDRSEAAAAGLLKRGLEGLRRRFHEPEE